uniref:Nucleoside diphosphate kinase n=1 Tax=Gongylonema pulchrum TaxID=637853 RepID=A0A183E765_9BILA
LEFISVDEGEAEHNAWSPLEDSSTDSRSRSSSSSSSSTFADNMTNTKERTFICIKPDAVHRGLVAKIIERFEQRGYKLVAMKMMRASKQHLEVRTIRGDFSIQMGRNIVHGSDSVPSAEREIAHWFKPDELCEWSPVAAPWVYEQHCGP